MTVMSSRIEHVPMRAPREHGRALQMPGLRRLPDVWYENARRLDAVRADLWDESLSQLRALAKREVVELAVAYTRQYRDIHRANLDGPIIAAGHQPQLYHPGVWYKNFVLSHWADQLQATPINLLIDNDICSTASIRVPTGPVAQPHLEVVPLDRAYSIVPYELRPVVDEHLFETFAQRVTTTIQTRVPDPLVGELWRPAPEIARWTANLGQRLGALRHHLEGQWGLQTLELPLSHVCRTESFCRFAALLIRSAEPLRRVYNEALYEYRRVNRVRSRSHPVPALEQDGASIETPFWVYAPSTGTRQRLFVQISPLFVTLTDRAGWSESMSHESLANWLQSQKADVVIRPRALMTTVFARLVLSQLFLHGIGGAKYDQLTDEIIRRLWDLEPPEFATLTATLKLPVDSPDAVPADLSNLKQRIRELSFHPEEHLDPGHPQYTTHRPLAEEKRRWTRGECESANPKQRHDAIMSLNLQLQEAVADKRAQLVGELQQTRADARVHQLLGSREFSFCLFPAKLLREQLERLAQGREAEA